MLGNQEGYTLVVVPNKTTNAASLQITSLTYPTAVTVNLTVIDHNLLVGDYVMVNACQGMTTLNGQILKVDAVASSTALTLSYTESSTNPMTGTYTGCGTLTRISKIDILTKQYNFFMDKGQNVYVAKIDMLVDKTENGQIAFDYYTSGARLPLAQGAIACGAAWGEPVLLTSPFPTIPYEAQQERLWHPIYLQAEGECVQVRLYYSDEQLLDPDIIEADFQLNAMMVYAQGISRLG